MISHDLAVARKLTDLAQHDTKVATANRSYRGDFHAKK